MITNLLGSLVLWHIGVESNGKIVKRRLIIALAILFSLINCCVMIGLNTGHLDSLQYNPEFGGQLREPDRKSHRQIQPRHSTRVFDQETEQIFLQSPLQMNWLLDIRTGWQRLRWRRRGQYIDYARSWIPLASQLTTIQLRPKDCFKDSPSWRWSECWVYREWLWISASSHKISTPQPFKFRTKNLYSFIFQEYQSVVCPSISRKNLQFIDETVRLLVTIQCLAFPQS